MGVSHRTTLCATAFAALVGLIVITAGPVPGVVKNLATADRAILQQSGPPSAISARADIITDSEIGYVRSLHDPLDNGASIIKCTAVCKDGQISGRIRIASGDGKVDSASHPKTDLDAYLRLWRALEDNGAMVLESSDVLLMRSKTPEDGPYESFQTSQDWYRFAFRVKDRRHIFEVYGIDLLKDKRYRAILDEIDRFLGAKPVKSKPRAVTTVIY